MAPPLLAKEGGPPPKKESNPRAIQPNTLPHLSSHRQTGFRHLSAFSTSSLGPPGMLSGSHLPHPAQGLLDTGKQQH
jgi:hypothetical protein